MKMPGQKSQISLNYAKMADGDVNALRNRMMLIKAAEAESQQKMAVVNVLKSEFGMTFKGLLRKYNLRKGKEFTYNLQHGYIHRPGFEPWAINERPIGYAGVKHNGKPIYRPPEMDEERERQKNEAKVRNEK